MTRFRFFADIGKYGWPLIMFSEIYSFFEEAERRGERKKKRRIGGEGVQ